MGNHIGWECSPEEPEDPDNAENHSPNHNAASSRLCSFNNCCWVFVFGGFSPDTPTPAHPSDGAGNVTHLWRQPVSVSRSPMSTLQSPGVCPGGPCTRGFTAQHTHATFSCDVNILTELICGEWDADTNTHIFVKKNLPDHYHRPSAPKSPIMEVAASVTPNMLHRTWNTIDYRLDMCRATKGAHIEIHWDY